MKVLRYLVAAFFVVAGVSHFLFPSFYVEHVPGVLPWPLGWVYLTGVAEVAGGGGLLVQGLRRAAAVGLVAMLLGFLWVHVPMLDDPPTFMGRVVPTWVLVARLPVQAVLIGLVVAVGFYPRRSSAS